MSVLVRPSSRSREASGREGRRVKRLTGVGYIWILLLRHQVLSDALGGYGELRYYVGAVSDASYRNQLDVGNARALDTLFCTGQVEERTQRLVPCLHSILISMFEVQKPPAPLAQCLEPMPPHDLLPIPPRLRHPLTLENKMVSCARTNGPCTFFCGRDDDAINPSD